jgi:hypothetical protein
LKKSVSVASLEPPPTHHQMTKAVTRVMTLRGDNFCLIKCRSYSIGRMDFTLLYIQFLFFLYRQQFILRTHNSDYQFLRIVVAFKLNFFKIDTIHGARRYAARACGACLCHKRCIFYLSTIFLWLYWHPRQYTDQNFEKIVFLYIFGQKSTFQVHFWIMKSENSDSQYSTFLCIFASRNFNPKT